MQTFDSARLTQALAWPDLIEAITAAVVSGNVETPPRSVATVPIPGEVDGNLLLMPAWEPGALIGVKAVTFVPSNAHHPNAQLPNAHLPGEVAHSADAGTNAVPTVNAGYLLFDGANGKFLAAMDGDTLTARRTAAASAVAADVLARPDAHRLLVVGTGQLSANMALAHATVRDYHQIEVWGRSIDKATNIAEQLSNAGLRAQAVNDLGQAVGRADVITCATASHEALVLGKDVGPGTHVDLVGSFKDDLRESDDALVAASRLYVDTRAGAMLAGDISQPLATGVITAEDIVGDLAELLTGACPGRTSEDEVTVYKSAGFALLDLAAAKLALG